MEWISVKDRLPEPETEVLVCTSFKNGDREIQFAMYEDGTITSEDSCYGWSDWLFPNGEKIPKGWWDSDRDMHNADDAREGMVYGAVTHWMPLPKAPQED